MPSSQLVPASSDGAQATGVLPDILDVTLVAVTSVATRATVQALRASIGQAHFGRALLLSDRCELAGADSDIEFRRIERLASRADYSRFMLRGLAEHIETSHALTVQWDGFVLDGSAWDPEFLDYDYIGAVWPHFRDGYRVGNGGFSLRSRRLLKACSTLPFDGSMGEDVVISRVWRPQLEAQGLRFAPEAVARRFAYERTAPQGHEFGFHGSFNLVRHLPAAEALRLFRSLEPEMLARNERLQIMRWAVTRGRLRLALEMASRLSTSLRTAG
jgi:Protein of unknown function (DUF5672)